MEWHRSKSIQRLEKVYKAEDKGVWLRSEEADNRLSVAAMNRPITSQKKQQNVSLVQFLRSIVKVGLLK